MLLIMAFLSLWAVCFLKLDYFCHFSLVQSFLAAFLPRFSGDNLRNQGLQKRPVILDASALFWTLT